MHTRAFSSAKQAVSLILIGLTTLLAACPNTEYEVGVYKTFRVVSVEPAGGAVDVPLEPVLKVTFSDDLLVSSLTSETIYLLDTSTGSKVAATLTYDNSGEQAYVATFALAPGLTTDPTPDNPADDPLGLSRWYEVHVTPNLKRQAKPDRPLEQIDEVGLPGEVVSGFWTADPPPLQVVTTTPAQAGTGAAIDTAIRVTFSEAVAEASVDSTSFSISDVTDYDPMGALVGSFSYEDSDATLVLQSGNIVVFTPEVALGYSRDVEVSLSTGLASARATDKGGNLAEPVTYRFSSEDPPPLTLVASSPNAHDVDVAVDTQLTLDFSESVDTGSVPPATTSISVQDITGGGSVALTGTWTVVASASVSNDRLVFVPDAGWPYAATVLVTLDAGVQSVRATPRGGQLGTAVAVEFQVVPPPPLLLLSTIPSAGEQRVNAETVVTLTFDQDVDPSTVDTASVSVTNVTLGGSMDGSLGVSGSVVTFTPAGGEFPLDTEVQVALAVSLAATPALGGGLLPQPLVITFRTSPAPPLEVVAFSPDGGVDLTVKTAPTVTFTTAVFEPTLPAGDVALNADIGFRVGTCDTLNDPPRTPCACTGAGEGAGVVSTVEGSISFEPATLTATYTPASDLAGATWYQVCASVKVYSLVGNALVPANAADDGTSVVFLTEPTNQVASTSPARAEENVSVTRPIVIDFDAGEAVSIGSITSASFAVTYVDPFGRDAPVPKVPDDVVASNGDLTLTFTPQVDSQPCPRIPHNLLYSTEYAVTLTAAVTAGGSPLTDGYAYTFTTAAAPFVVTTWPQDGDTGVPVVDPLLLTLSGEVDPSSLAGNVLLDLKAGGSIALDTVAVDSAGSSTFVVTPTSRLDFDSTYVLTVTGGPGGVSVLGADGFGNYLPVDVQVEFTTTTELAVLAWLPEDNMGTKLPINSAFGLLFDRPVNPSTVNAATFEIAPCSDACGTACGAGNAGPPIAGLLSFTDDNAAALFVPTPELAKSTHFVLTLLGGDVIEDAWGNPFDAGAFTEVCTSSSKSNNDISVTLAGPTTPASATAEVTVAFGKQPNPDGLTCAGLIVRRQGQTQNLCRSVTYDAASLQATVQITDAASESYLVGGGTYDFDISQIISDMQFNPAAAFTTASFVVESTPPAFVSATPTGAGVVASSTVVLSFDEPMLTSSFVNDLAANGGTFSLTDSPTTFVAGSFSAQGNDIIFTPAAPLVGGTSYTIAMTTGVTDLGGTALGTAPATSAFTVESTPPTFDSVAAAGGGDDILLTFSEPMAPGSLVPTVTVRLHEAACPGDPDVTVSGAPIMVCLSLNAAGTEVTLDPCPNAADATEEIPTGGADYCVAVTTGATDLGGTALAGASSVNSEARRTINL